MPIRSTERTARLEGTFQAVAPADPRSSFEDWTKADLKAEAARRGIETTTRMTKTELIEALEAS